MARALKTVCRAAVAPVVQCDGIRHFPKRLSRYADGSVVKVCNLAHRFVANFDLLTCLLPSLAASRPHPPERGAAGGAERRKDS